MATLTPLYRSQQVSSSSIRLWQRNYRQAKTWADNQKLQSVCPLDNLFYFLNSETAVMSENISSVVSIHSFIHTLFPHHIKTIIKTTFKIHSKWYGWCDQTAKRPEVITPQHKKYRKKKPYRVNLQSKRHRKWTDIESKKTSYTYTQQNETKDNLLQTK